MIQPLVKTREYHDSVASKGEIAPKSVYHREILREIKQHAAQEGAPYVDHGDSYIGTTKPCYLIRTAVVRQNVHKRRAGLVLLTEPLRESADPRLARLAFANIGKLKGDKDILITKAVSWLLRALIKHHRQEVERYLKDNSNSLPKIALRETRNKLKSGHKSGKL